VYLITIAESGFIVKSVSHSVKKFTQYINDITFFVYQRLLFIAKRPFNFPSESKTDSETESRFINRTPP